MVPDNQERHRTAYTVTVDYKHGRCQSVNVPVKDADLFSLISNVEKYLHSLQERRLGSPHMTAAQPPAR
jgi:hypothetical protein